MEIVKQGTGATASTARPASAADIPRCVAMMRRFVAQTGRRGTFRADLVEQTMRLLMEGGILLVSGRGMIGGLIMPLWQTGEPVAHEFFWWGDARLLAAFEEAARDRGATAIHMAALEGRVARHYERRGYRKLETIWLKEF